MTGQKQYPKTYRFRPNPAGKPYQPDPANKERDLETARRIQRRLLFPKFGFLTGFLPLLIAMVYEKLTGGPVSEGFIIFGFCYVFTVWPLTSALPCFSAAAPTAIRPKVSTAGLYTLTGREISTSRGVSPFITKCIRCGAPLSVKEVEAAYRRLEEQEKAT